VEVVTQNGQEPERVRKGPETRYHFQGHIPSDLLKFQNLLKECHQLSDNHSTHESVETFHIQIRTRHIFFFVWELEA
jgi:hypothetical protein